MSIVSNHQPEVIAELNPPADETTVRTRRPRPKPERRVRLAVALNAEGKNGLLSITVGKAVASYHLSAIPSDWGTAFSVEKIGGTDGPYHVCLTGMARTCDCIGHLAHGHCKHADGIACLMQLGKLTVNARGLQVVAA